MHDLTRKMLRTLQVHVPRFQSSKYRFKRAYLNLRKIPSESDFLALLLFPGREGALHLDVGANRGQSIDALLLTAPASPIESFEPNPLLTTQLKHVYRRRPTVTIHGFGLGNTCQALTLYVPFYRNWMFDGLASLRKTAAEQALDDQLFFFNRRLLSVREIECRIERLDDLRVAPVFIKVDVEGFELEVLQGGACTIAEHEPILLIESPQPKTIELLNGLGYQHYAFEGGRFRSGEFGVRNTFFLTSRWADTVRGHIDPGSSGE